MTYPDPVPGPAYPAPVPPPPAPRRNAAALITAVIAVIAVAGVAVWAFATSSSRDEPSADPTNATASVDPSEKPDDDPSTDPSGEPSDDASEKPTERPADSAFSDDIAVPAVADAQGGISFGSDGTAGSTSGDSAVRVDLYVDFMCPGCGAFESTVGEDLGDLVDEGTITLVVHPLSFLDRFSEGTEYSTRAASAFAYVAEESPEHAYDFQAALFADQPEEGTGGLSDEEIADLAIDAGVAPEVAGKIADNPYRDFVGELTALALGTGGVEYTPTVHLDGVEFTGDWSKPGELVAAIEAAHTA